ncbi:uncharacterized protein PSANT_03225 [Moesziomyces antarcticus]|uniref:Uncharacterized protein n=1 Tax=Pseudozyma antarctica TaxID=84753 RepID=A0A5C3FQ42_PSEA2|nr:uncharacterized protein PSANT_03225 [Moesziomyces antarcticus]
MFRQARILVFLILTVARLAHAVNLPEGELLWHAGMNLDNAPGRLEQKLLVKSYSEALGRSGTSEHATGLPAGLTGAFYRNMEREGRIGEAGRIQGSDWNRWFRRYRAERIAQAAREGHGWARQQQSYGRIANVAGHLNPGLHRGGAAA